jgi:hypothetical protein
MKASEGKLAICRTVIARMPSVCVVAFAVGGSSPTGAAIPDANGVFHACYEKSGGALRVIDSTKTTCRSNESPILWNHAGPAGVPGPQGVPGTAGPRGPSGAFVSDNFSAGFVSVVLTGDALAPTRLAAVALPAGSYVFNAAIALYVDVAVGTLVPFSNVRCALSGSTGTIGMQVRATVGGSASSYATLPLVAAVTLANAETVVLGCVAESGPPVSTQPSVLTAVQVEALRRP